MELYSFIGVGLGRELSIFGDFRLGEILAIRPPVKGLRPFYKGVTRTGVVNATLG